MRRPLVLLIVTLTIALTGAWLFGCGSDSDSPTSPKTGTIEPNWPENAIGLPAEDEEVLDSAAVRYAELLETLSPVAARHALVDELTSDGGLIDIIKLGSDSVTISVRFTDGVGAVLITDEMMFPSAADSPVNPAVDAARLELIRRNTDRVAQAIARKVDCGDLVMPSSHKVSIVNMAGGSNLESRVSVQEMKQSLIDMGWTEDEITINERQSVEDYTFVPDDMFEQTGNGIVLYMGHGGFHTAPDGSEHYMIQSFHGGKREAYEGTVTDERWDEYKKWYRQDHTLIEGYAISSTDGSYIREIYMRDDLLAEQVKVDDGAMVAFIACNSIQLADEMESAGAGAVMGWDGQTNCLTGPDNFLGLIENMTGDESMTDEQALAGLYSDGKGKSTGHYGEDTYYKAADISGDFHLPGWGKLSAPADNFPDGTAEVDVTISYEDCPEQDLSFTLAIGEEIDVESLIPGEATIIVTAKNASGQTVGVGKSTKSIKSGVNEIEVESCEAELTLGVDDYPQESDGTATNVEYTITYLGVDAAPVEGDFAPGSPTTVSNLLPLPAVITSTALDGSTELAVSADTVDLQCGDNDGSICFGWLVLSAGEVIAGVTDITVTIDGGISAPESVSFGVGSDKNVFGFRTDEEVTLTAEGFDTYGVSQGVVSLTPTVECGANEVEINITAYAVVLEASPHKVAADGTSTATLTATLRGWKDGDLTEPTGDPIPGKLVEFDASCGSFVGASSGISDANGQVTVALSSSEACVAEIHAFVMDDLAESHPAYVNFGLKMSFWINGSDDAIPDAAPHGLFRCNCVMMKVYFKDQLITDREMGDPGGYGMYCPRWAVPGDVIRFEFTSFTAEDYCTDGPSTVEPIYLHTLYEADFDHQDLYLMTNGIPSVSGTVTLEVEIEEIEYYED